MVTCDQSKDHWSTGNGGEAAKKVTHKGRNQNRAYLF